MNVRALVAFASRRISLRAARHVLMALSVMMLTAVVASVLLFRQAIEQTARRVIDAGPSLVISRVDAGGWASIPSDEAKRMSGVPGVISATPRVWGILPGPPAVTLVGSPDLQSSPPGAVAGAGVPGAARGAMLTLRGLDGVPVDVRVDEVLGRETDLIAFDTVLVPMDVARRLLLIGAGDATDIVVQSVRVEEDEALARDIAAGSPTPLRIVTRAQMRGAYVAQAGQRGGLAYLVMIPAAIALALLVAGIAAGGAGARQEVGRLKLAGWTSGQVAALHLTEIGLVAWSSTAAGLVLAYLQVFVLGGGPFLSLVLGWGPSAPRLWLDPQGAVLALVQVGALVIVPCLVAAVLPAWRLARVDPAELLEAS